MLLECLAVLVLRDNLDQGEFKDLPGHPVLPEKMHLLLATLGQQELWDHPDLPEALV